jgi:hypothetical protein
MPGIHTFGCIEGLERHYTRKSERSTLEGSDPGPGGPLRYNMGDAC